MAEKSGSRSAIKGLARLPRSNGFTRVRADEQLLNAKIIRRNKMKGLVFIAVRDQTSDLFPQKCLNFLSVFGFCFGTFEAFMDMGDLSTPIN